MVEQIVTSRYFQKSGMDESFTDFKEKKNIFTEPKSKKPKGKKQITKKRIKGQKDIRTLIRSKKNELLTFTKDFNDVCAKGGVDIDSQELQLAIALSKSLQQSDRTETEEIPTNNLTTQERTNRIRRTLQEYGFRVPQIKIKLEGCKRVKKYRKSYKLLQITEEERLQKICNKYTQVLFENPDKSFEKDTNDFNTGSKLYYLATNTTYGDIKTNIVYATEILQEISFTKGNLLRNWSDIPGRPESPKLIEEYVISMPDLQCSQYELDIILSGAVNKAKDILKSKLNYLEINVEVNNTSVETKLKTKDFDLKGGQVDFTMLHEDRSNSPDIFDDDHSIDLSVTDYDKKKIKNGDSNISMLDLIPPTQAINKNPCSQSSNTTKRRTNDFMDLTECIVTSQCKTKLLETEELTNNSIEFTNCVNPISQESKISKDKIKSLSPECVLLDEPAVVSEQKVDNSLDETIIVKDYVDLTQYCPKQLEDSLKIDNMETMDLTQSSNSNDELPAVNIPGTQRFSPHDVIVQHDGNIPQRNIKPSNSNELNVTEVNDIVLDISNEIPELSFNAQNISTILHNSQNRIEDFAKNTSFSLTATSFNKENDDIDLTQSSDSTIDGYYENFTSNVSKNGINYNSLGKKGDISIDYDIAFDKVEENVCQIDEQSKDSESKSTNNFHIVASDTSDNFKLRDRELNYSI